MQVEGGHRAARADPVLAGLTPGDEHDGPVEALDEPGGDDADDAAVPVLARDHVPQAAALRLRPLLNLANRVAQDPLLDRLPIAVERLELARQPACLRLVLREQQVECRAGMTQTARRVDARRETEGDRASVERRRVDPAHAHERLQPRLVRPRESPHPRRHEGAVFVEERDDVRDGCQCDEVEMAVEPVGAERLEQLEDDAGAAKLRERVLRRPRRHDRAVRQRLAGAMVVGDDHVQARRAGLGDLLHGCDTAVDREDEGALLLREARQRVSGDAVTLLEAAREVPLDVGAEAAQRRDRERGRADPVDVVVAVHADAPTGGDRLPHERAGGLDVSEQEGVVPRGLGGEKGPRRLGVAVAPPDEDACRRFADAERLGELTYLPAGARTHRPGALVHRVPP